MRTLRFAVWFITVMAGALYTIIQTGPETAGTNLCKLVQKVVPGTSVECVPNFERWGPTAVLVMGLIFGVLVVLDVAGWVNRRRASTKKPMPARYDDKDAALIDAVFWVAFRSSWGRWQSAQRGTSDEYSLMQSAASYVLKVAGNGELIVRGRIPGSSRFEQIDRHFWLGHLIHIEPDAAHIWKATVYERPTTKVIAPSYNGYLVEVSSLEMLWPKKDRRIDWRTRKIRFKRALSDLAGRRVSEMGPSLIIAGLAISLIGLVLVGAGAWSLRSTGKATASPKATESPAPSVQIHPAQTISTDPRPQRPHYDNKEISEMISTMRKLNDVIDKKYAPAQQSLADSLHNWDARVRSDLTNTKIDQIKEDRDALISARAEILQIFKDNEFYKSEFASIIAHESEANSSMQDALNRFVTDVTELSQHKGIDLPKFAHPALDRLQAENEKMAKWVKDAKIEIQRKSEELRQWINP